MIVLSVGLLTLMDDWKIFLRCECLVPFFFFFLYFTWNSLTLQRLRVCLRQQLY